MIPMNWMVGGSLAPESGVRSCEAILEFQILEPRPWIVHFRLFFRLFGVEIERAMRRNGDYKVRKAATINSVLRICVLFDQAWRLEKLEVVLARLPDICGRKETLEPNIAAFFISLSGFFDKSNSVCRMELSDKIWGNGLIRRI
jgi:hypothetical protein